MARVLIVEDSIVVAFATKRILSSNGCRPECVHTLRDALREMDEQWYRVVILDLSLPDGDGLEAIGDMRRRHPRSRVIATSGFMLGDMPKAARDAGADGILIKPATARDIRKAVGEFLATE